MMAEGFRRVALAVQRRFNHFDPAIRDYDPSVVDGALAPVFIVAAPRTGTTLVYQVLVQQLGVAFISNLMSAVPQYMVRMCQAWSGICTRPPARLQRGHYGFLGGLLSPSEAGKVMDNWFGPGMTAEKAMAVRKTFAGIGSLAGGPMLVKSLSLVNGLRTVQELFPAARFIRVWREPAFAAQSLLLGKRDPRIPAERWAGVEPGGSIPPEDCGDAYRAAWQVRRIQDILETGLQAEPSRVVDVQYEAFCGNPTRVLQAISERFGLAARAAAPRIPTRFDPSNIVRVDPATWDEIGRALAELASRHHAGASSGETKQSERARR